MASPGNIRLADRRSLVVGGVFLALVFVLLVSALLVVFGDRGAGVIEQVVDSVIVGPGQADYSFDLAKGYSLVRSGPHRRSIDRRSGDGALPSDRGAPTTPVIDWDVTQLGWDNRFIVCFQAGNQDADGATGWWIIDTLNDSRFGPMNKDAYVEKLRMLNISPAIPVRPVESYGRTGVRAEKAEHHQ